MPTNLYFEKVILKNFLSYAYAELDLNDQGYCLIKGQNNFEADAALSNGAGKSSWISAICWCLTGETIQGVKSNLQNIYVAENESWVQLDFRVNKDQYKLVRYIKPKSDLKLFINGQDKSGKGLRESELQLSQFLPDLTKELIAETILFGQGLPDKLSSLTPAGRKEMLEKLSKSNYMIEDISNRLEQREDTIARQLREIEDDLVKNNSQIAVYSTQIEGLTADLQNIKTKDYDSSILDLSNQIASIQNEIQQYSKAVSGYEVTLDAENSKLLDLTSKKQTELNEELTQYIANSSGVKENKIKLESNINQLNNEITRLKNIKDICPTCGQKIPNVIKPDTTLQEQQVSELRSQKQKLDEQITNLEAKHKTYITDINKLFDNDISSVNASISELKRNISDTRNKLANLQATKTTLDSAYNKAVSDKENLLENIKHIENNIKETKKSIQTLEESNVKLNNQHDTLKDHEAVVRKMRTLVKRDFRGYLLTNVINYIDSKAKEYALEVFDNSNIEFTLNGNNIDIYFNDKTYESLSGGEKQKIDLIIQFAVRDMLETYLDFRSNILVLDEITDALDEIGCTRVFNLISKRLVSIESIFIISHHYSELSIPADKELNVVKDSSGISTINYLY